MNEDSDFYPPPDYRTVIYCRCPQTVLLKKPGIYEVDPLQFTTHLQHNEPIKRVRLFSNTSTVQKNGECIVIDGEIHAPTDCDIVVPISINVPMIVRSNETISIDEEDKTVCTVL